MNIHIVGIEGAGTSALAQLYRARGDCVSGSDDGDGFYRQQLRDLGITLYEDFDAQHIRADCDRVVYSTALGDDNSEIVQARMQGVPVIPYPEAVAHLFNDAVGVAVCGTHGKTTTTAMIAETLAGCGYDPCAIVGSQIVGWQGNALTGSGDVMVLEADEYQNKLRYYNPSIVVLTSVDYDHPDFFKTPKHYMQAFIDFVARVPASGFVVACGDSSRVREVIASAQCRVITYGFDAVNDVVVTNVQMHHSEHVAMTFQLNVHAARDTTLVASEYTLRLPGRYNALNATAAIIVAQEMGCASDTIAHALAQFRGARRRFEYHGTYHGAVLIDDYAHHPAEVRATLNAVRQLYPTQRVVAAFHPHTFTRTKALLDDFAQSFGMADEVIVIDIYGSAREEHGGVHARDVVHAIAMQHSGTVHYIPTIDVLAQWARTNLGNNDVFITLGAGDIWKVMDNITKQ